MKLNPKPDAAIICMSDVGPTFGNSSYFDLTVWDLPAYNSRLALGNGFTCPKKNHRNTYLAGVSPFQVSELEVFKVNL